MSGGRERTILAKMGRCPRRGWWGGIGWWWRERGLVSGVEPGGGVVGRGGGEVCLRDPSLVGVACRA